MPKERLWTSLGLNEEEAGQLSQRVESIVAEEPRPTLAWKKIYSKLLSHSIPWEVQYQIYNDLATSYNAAKAPFPHWFPEKSVNTNIEKILKKWRLKGYSELYRFSINQKKDFWKKTIQELDIIFETPPATIYDEQNQRWLPNARLNIAQSCFRADNQKKAIVFDNKEKSLSYLTYGQLEELAFEVANGLRRWGLAPQEAVAIDMPMTPESVAIYLGILIAGGTVVSIADSFAPEEIATRLKISNTRLIFTQDFLPRGEKQIPLYEKVIQATTIETVVLPAAGLLSQINQEGKVQRFSAPKATFSTTLREQDHSWAHFLHASEKRKYHFADANDSSNVLFSSGTTGDPKAIPWTHLTPIKAASDGFFHHNIQPHSLLCWPTNLGWMMGPWLIYATFLNRATMALYQDVPTTADFTRFVEKARVTMLGIVPSLAKAWFGAEALQEVDWSSIELFSSTGECSSPQEMFRLSAFAGYKPIIEYCGGTEIGGGYITSTVVEPNAPSTFSTPALGSEFLLLDEEGNETNEGEVFLVPPTIGLSEDLLNHDHHKVYYAETPPIPLSYTQGKEEQSQQTRPLRRHGDHIERLGEGYYRARGRVDDTMNLGGIKISSAEIEQVLNELPTIKETAAIGLPPFEGGPEQLAIVAVLNEPTSKKNEAAKETNNETAIDEIDLLKSEMQKAIKTKLNPLFHVTRVVVTDSLPRTASNKVMRRTLRSELTK
ncbi:MAG: AMP-binding protein [Pirellulaceae bacterium]|nr:AMP-binding protein [Pirellulaceae bacterium]